ncbi:acyl-CoA dehydrogenase family protein [Blastococcus sp. URHD0036]|uniref:acyl-CoA dehydrogenase family protein n=1 Tax=Blastococcus sp. URHD0036 TaxID=1380356 RepID=UPI00049810D0|nr:acyl-CoA dehydrogenase family protein [Blastococcus sp. URHD0036]
MSDQDLVVETVRDLLGAHELFVLTPERPWDEGLWKALVDTGLTGVGIAEEDGGSGGELADAVAIVRTLAAGAAAVPLAEQLLVAAPALLAAGLPVPPVEQPVTVAVAPAVTAEPDGDGRFRLTGTVPAVPSADVATSVVVLVGGAGGPVLAVLDTAGLAVTSSANLAGEPRGTLTFDATPAAGARLSAEQAESFRARYALARSVQIAAALEQVLSWTVQYAGERQQFGRPLAKFQAIQMELAEMAGEVTAVTAIVDAAVQALDRGEDVVLAAAAAKVRAGAAVEVVARLAHQVHGAIGFTQEYRLHHLTRRCWSWRDEAGTELEWSRVLGAGLVAGGGDDLWTALTRVV